MSSLLMLLKRVVIGPHDQADYRVWSLDPKGGLFSVQSMYKVQALLNLNPQPTSFIWHSALLSKCRLHLWLVYLGKVLTLDNLAKKGVHIVNKCCLCYENEESISHLVLHCLIAFRV